MNKRKILIAVNGLYGGGAEKVFQTFINNLNMHKYDVTICLLHQEKIDTHIYTKPFKSFYIYRSNMKNGILENFLVKCYNKFVQLVYEKCSSSFFYKMFVKKDNYDIEIAFIEGYATRIIAGSTNSYSKKYAWVHIDLEQNPWSSISYKSFDEEKSCYKMFDKIFCVSNHVRESFKKKFGIDNVIVQYNPVDENEILTRANEIIDNFDHKQVNLVTIGRLEHQKGYDRLLRIVNKLKNEGYQFKLYILGEGSLRKQFEKYIIENDLEEYISLLGFKNNPYPYLRQADLFVCSSYSEGFSTVATEAMILNVPIVTTDCSGMKELFGDYECGIIVDNNEESLYHGIKRILDNMHDLLFFKDQIKYRKEYFKLDKRMTEYERLLDE